MMAKVKIKNLKSVFNSINLIFESSIKQSAFLNEVKDFAVLRVQAETRKGKDLPGDRDQPKLSEGYIKFRQRVAKGLTDVTPDSSFFKPEKSNLTLTGQLLSSLTGKVIKSQSIIEIKVSGRRSDGEDNANVAKDLASRGRKFLGLDIKGIRLIRKMVLDEIRRAIRRV